MEANTFELVLAWLEHRGYQLRGDTNPAALDESLYEKESVSARGPQRARVRVRGIPPVETARLLRATLKEAFVFDDRILDHVIAWS